jgi:hypothetical protein
MGRASLLSVLVALLLVGTPSAAWPAAAGSAYTSSASYASSYAPRESSASSRAAGCDGDFLTKLECWRRQTKEGKRVEVSLSRPLRLDASADRVDWLAYQAAFTGELFTVSVSGGRESGAGGTVLMILARGRQQRAVAPDSQITTLPDSTLRALSDVCDALCAAVDAGTAGRAVPGKTLIDNRLARTIPAGGGGSAWRVVFPVILVLLFALLGFTVLRTRRRVATDLGAADEPYAPFSPATRGAGEAPSARQARGAPADVAPADPHQARRRYGRRVTIPPGPRRGAVIRSDLHPQGYVEVDRCLFRAVWADDRVPVPGLGAAVDVVQGAGDDSDILLALPPSPNQR